MCGSPSGAMTRNHEIRPYGYELVDRGVQDRFEETPGEVETSYESTNVFDPRDTLHMS